MSTYEFKEDAGKFVAVDVCRKRIDKRHEAFKAKGLGPHDYVHSQFFGKQKLLELLKHAGDDCVGVRICFAHKEDGADADELIIYAVDGKGLALECNPEQKTSDSAKEGIAKEKMALTGGPTCPDECGQGGFP